MVGSVGMRGPVSEPVTVMAGLAGTVRLAALLAATAVVVGGLFGSGVFGRPHRIASAQPVADARSSVVRR